MAFEFLLEDRFGDDFNESGTDRFDNLALFKNLVSVLNAAGWEEVVEEILLWVKLFVLFVFLCGVEADEDLVDLVVEVIDEVEEEFLEVFFCFLLGCLLLP